MSRFTSIGKQIYDDIILLVAKWIMHNVIRYLVSSFHHDKELMINCLCPAWGTLLPLEGHQHRVTIRNKLFSFIPVEVLTNVVCASELFGIVIDFPSLLHISSTNFQNYKNILNALEIGLISWRRGKNIVWGDNRSHYWLHWSDQRLTELNQNSTKLQVNRW